MLPIAHASDAAGSIRIPASCCGVFGFKPSRSVLPNFYTRVDRAGFCSVNCVSQSVEDSAAFLDTLLGRAYPPDAPPEGSFLHGCRQPLGRLRIRYCVSSPIANVEAPVARAVIEAAERLRALGHAVEEGEPLQAGIDDFLPLWQRMAANMPLPSLRIGMPSTRWLRTAGRSISMDQATALAATLSRTVNEWFGEADAWLIPSVGPHPPRIGESLRPDVGGEAWVRALAPLAVFTAPFNVTGQPAASLPWGRSNHSVPFAVQIVGQPNRDAMVFRLCRALEAARAERGSPGARAARGGE
jgi:Asp-tRNA(Asn)/Glu-tRNA(Gln) amidotransferase A subunit family amidase